jgi:hypothetical protein
VKTNIHETNREIDDLKRILSSLKERSSSMISNKQNLHTKYMLTSDSLTEQQQRYQHSQTSHLQDQEKLMKLQDEKKTLLNEVSYLSGTGGSGSSSSSAASASSFPPVSIDQKPAPAATSVKSSMNSATNNESVASSAFPSTKTELSSSVIGGAGGKKVTGGDDAFSTLSVNEPSMMMSSSSPRKEDPVPYSPLPSSSSVASSSMKKEEIDPFGDAFSSAGAADVNNNDMSNNTSRKNEEDPFGDPFDDSAFGTEQSATSMKSISTTTVSSSVVSPFSVESGKPSTPPPKPVKPAAAASSEDPFGGFDESAPVVAGDPFGDPFGDADNGGAAGYSSPKKEGGSMKSGSSSVLSDDPFSDFDDNIPPPKSPIPTPAAPFSTSSPLPPTSSSMKSTGSSSTVSGAAPVVPDPCGVFDDDIPAEGLTRHESDPFAVGIAASLGENDPFGAPATTFPSSTTPENDDPFDSFGGADVGGGADPFGGFDAAAPAVNKKASSFGEDDDAFSSSAFVAAADPFVNSNKKPENDDPFGAFDE